MFRCVIINIVDKNPYGFLRSLLSLVRHCGVVGLLLRNGCIRTVFIKYKTITLCRRLKASINIISHTHMFIKYV